MVLFFINVICGFLLIVILVIYYCGGNGIRLIEVGVIIFFVIYFILVLIGVFVDMGIENLKWW